MGLREAVIQETLDGFGPEQQVAGLPNGYQLRGNGTDRVSLVHLPCLRLAARFGEAAAPDEIITAANDHWCHLAGQGAGNG